MLAIWDIIFVSSFRSSDSRAVCGDETTLREECWGGRCCMVIGSENFTVLPDLSPAGSLAVRGVPYAAVAASQCQWWCWGWRRIISFSL